MKVIIKMSFVMKMFMMIISFVREFQIGKRPSSMRHLWIKPSPSFGLFAEQNSPANLLRVGKNADLDGFMFGGCGHGESFVYMKNR